MNTPKVIEALRQGDSGERQALLARLKGRTKQLQEVIWTKGARFDGGPLTRARRLLPLAVPLFAGCLHRADVLAMAMEARGFRGSAERTQMDPAAFARRDVAALAGTAAALTLLFWLRGG